MASLAPKTVSTEGPKRYLIRQFSVEVVREPGAKDGRAMRSAEDVAFLARTLIPDDEREHFGIFCLNNKNRLIAYHEVSVGTLTASLVHPREVFKPAILAGSAALVLTHNHPSGDPAPSPEDLEITKRLKECADIFGMRLLDHVIIGHGSGRHYSFSDKGLL